MRWGMMINKLMKNIILSFIVIIGFSAASIAQCTTDPQYADSTFGAWPDTLTNLASGQVGVPYSDVLQFKIPADAGDVDPTYAGVPIDSVILDNVNGLAPGLTFTCNTSDCTWPGDSQGCAEITGTPTTAGTYDITIDLVGYVTVFGPVSQTATFTGYKIVVSPVAGIEMVHKDDFGLKNNVPNPFTDVTTIEFVTGQQREIDFNVINLLGEVVHHQIVAAVPGTNKIEFNGEKLPNGIYVCSLSNGESIISKRMMKNE